MSKTCPNIGSNNNCFSRRANRDHNIEQYLEPEYFTYSNEISLDDYPNFEYSKDTSNYKGFRWEKEGREGFRRLAYINNENYQGNPTKYPKWLREHNKNSYDAKITLPNGESIKLEYKFTSPGVKVYHSWFKRDWITRDADIIVASNPHAITYWDKRELKRQGKKILSLSKAKVHINQLIHRQLYPNKYLYLNSLICFLLGVVWLPIVKSYKKSKEALNKITSKLLILDLNRIKKSGFQGR